MLVFYRIIKSKGNKSKCKKYNLNLYNKEFPCENPIVVDRF